MRRPGTPAAWRADPTGGLLSMTPKKRFSGVLPRGRAGQTSRSGNRLELPPHGADEGAEAAVLVERRQQDVEARHRRRAGPHCAARVFMKSRRTSQGQHGSGAQYKLRSTVYWALLVKKG